MIKATLFGQQSLWCTHDYAKPDTMGVLWGISSIEDLPVSTFAIFAVIIQVPHDRFVQISVWFNLLCKKAVFLVSNDPEFQSNPCKTWSKIDYPQLLSSYKKLILKFQTNKPRKFDQLLEYYDKIIFDQGVKESLCNHTGIRASNSNSSDCDFDSSSGDSSSDEQWENIGEMWHF